MFQRGWGCAHFYLIIRPPHTPRTAQAQMADVSLMDDAEFEARLKKAFATLRDVKRPDMRKKRALGFVPWMSKSQLFDRFKRNDFSRKKMGRPPMLDDEALRTLYKHVEGQWEVGKPIGKKGLKKKFKAMGKALGYDSRELTRARTFNRFRRANMAKVVKGQKTDTARFFAVTHDTTGRFADVSELAKEGVKPRNTWVCDEAGFAAESHDRDVSFTREPRYGRAT